MYGAAGNIACYGPVLAERANVVIELFVMYKADYLLCSGSFWYSDKFCNIFFLNCLSYSSNITGKNYDSFCSHDK